MLKTLTYPLAVLMLGLPQAALAQSHLAEMPAHKAANQEAVASIVEQVRAAYGGKKLENLKSVRIQTDRGMAWPGQGQTPLFVEFVTDKFDVQIDLTNRRASVERWIQQNGNVFHTRRVSAPDGGVASINYWTGTYEINEDATFTRTYGIEITGSDTLIAHALVTDPYDIILEEPVYYLGHWHDRVTFKIAPKGFPGTAFIERDTGRITRYEVKLGSHTWNAVFSDFQTSRGITYARKRMDFRDDKMLQTDPDRRHSFNSVRWSDFEIEDYLTSPEEQVDHSEMTIDEIAPNVHHVGQEDYSAFIDAGEYIIGTNPYAGFKDRFEAYRAHRQNMKPLKYALSTHHHSDHLSGVTEAIELGATVLGTPMTIETLKRGEPSYSPDKLQIYVPEDSFGPVKTYTVATPHTPEHAIIYVPDAKVVYQDDHYNPTAVHSPSHVNQAGLVFRNRVNERELDVDIILSGHARKAEKWTDFEAAASQEKLGEICPRNRKICRD